MNWYDGLNEEQQKAVAHDFGPMLILAGAGSGKTTTLVARTGRLISERITRPENMCVLTFTNKAARELKHRVEVKLSKNFPKVNKQLYTGTFHSFGVRTLKTYHKEANLPKHFGIMDQQDSAGVIREILKDYNLYKKDKFDPDLLIAQMSRWREVNQKESKTDQEYDITTEWLLPKYLRKKELLGVVDFDDLILKVIDLYKSHPAVLEKEQDTWQQLMVDEFQDTNIGQMKLVQLLSQKNNNISVVGDDDQSIYGWRGAQVQNILDFPKKYKDCLVVRLEKNYRSTEHILNLANNVISKNDKRHGKILVNPKNKDISVGALPEVFKFDLDMEEIEGVAREIQSFKEKGYKNKEIAVLFRANAQGALLESTMREKQIPYKISGGMSFLERKEVKDVHGYMKCAFKPNDVDFRRIFNTPSRGLGETTLEKIVENSKALNSTFYKCAMNWALAGVSPKAGETIDSLYNFLESLKKEMLTNTSFTPGQLLLKAMEQVGYRQLLNDISKDQLMGQKRWNLVEAYARWMDRFIEKRKRDLPTFDDFITSLDLRDQEDEDREKDEVQLMTLHACKGLEFPCVILIGLEEDILPHKRLGGDISEERRLFYVGITRAQQHLIMTYSQKRQINGKWVYRIPSRFLEEANPKYYQRFNTGHRPLAVDQRKKMLSDLMKQLDGNK
ncbi:MAG: UvrD-helicase domain-containing protein [Bdellovibrionota bacterium]